MSNSFTLNCSVLKAMAFGGVDMGRAIAREQEKATPTRSGERLATLNPITIGIIRLAVAVLLISEDIVQATMPKMRDSMYGLASCRGSLTISQSASPPVDIIFPRQRPPPINNNTSQDRARRSLTVRNPRPNRSRTGIRATVPEECP